MTSSSEGFLNYIVEPEGRCVEIAKGKLLPVGGSKQLEVVAKQPGDRLLFPWERFYACPTSSAS